MNGLWNRVRRSLLVSLIGGSSLASGADFHVGPSQPLASPADVPWASLVAGDRVFIHWRNQPYKVKWVLNRQGTALAPIVVQGVRGPSGQRPVIDGRDAVTATGLNFWNEERGVLKIGGSNTPPDGVPSHLVIAGLEIRSGRPPFGYVGDDGLQHSYVDNAAAIYVEKAQHLTIVDCVLHDSGNGLFIGAFDGVTRDIVVESNSIYGNGNVGSAFHHNTYTAAIGIVYRYNRFGPLRAGADGNNLKDRSAGLVVHNNWIEGGNRQLDLVDAEDSQALVQHASYGETHVFGNVLIEPDGAGNSQIVHYGGDSGTFADYRKGTLFFYNNTVVSTRSGNTTLLRLSTNDEHADVRNNILYVSAPGWRLAMLAEAGVLDLSHNWTKPDWVDAHGPLSGQINDDGSGLESSEPGFVDVGAQDLRLRSDAVVRDLATGHAAGLSVELYPWQEYLEHQQGVRRPWDRALDLGAFEACDENPCALVFADGFEGGETVPWR